MADRRIALAAQLFGITGGSESQCAMAHRIGELILADLIHHATDAWKDCGAGVLVIRQTTRDAIWSDAADIRSQLAIAEQQQDSGMIRILRSMLTRLDDLNIERQVPIAFADHHGLRFYLLDTANPTTTLKALIAAAAGA